MPRIREQSKKQRGFTLVELMVAVLLTGIAVISIYRGYTAFSQSADAQQQVMEMQQNLRIGMSRLIADIRRAGMNEEDVTVAGFIKAGEEYIEFSMDLGSANGPVNFATDGEDNDEDGVADDDPDPDIAANEAEEESRIGDGDVDDDGERIRYQLLPDEDLNGNHELDPGEDTNGNNVLDSGRLERGVWDKATMAYITQIIIINVETIDFVYWDEGSPDASPPVAPAELNPTIEDPPGSGIFYLDALPLSKVDRVEITLVVRTTNEDYRYTNVEKYTNLLGEEILPPQGDNFRRRAFSISVQIRNNI